MACRPLSRHSKRFCVMSMQNGERLCLHQLLGSRDGQARHLTRMVERKKPVPSKASKPARPIAEALDPRSVNAVSDAERPRAPLAYTPVRRQARLERNDLFRL